VAGATGDNLFRGFETVPIRHVQIHHHDIWVTARHHGHRLSAGRRFTHDRHVLGAAENSLQAAADNRMIVCEQHANHAILHGDPPFWAMRWHRVLVVR
jgi:hypothetical protein